MLLKELLNEEYDVKNKRQSLFGFTIKFISPGVKSKDDVTVSISRGPDSHIIDIPKKTWEYKIIHGSVSKEFLEDLFLKAKKEEEEKKDVRQAVVKISDEDRKSSEVIRQQDASEEDRKTRLIHYSKFDKKLNKLKK